jgi:hypothetical protein
VAIVTLDELIAAFEPGGADTPGASTDPGAAAPTAAQLAAMRDYRHRYGAYGGF